MRTDFQSGRFVFLQKIIVASFDDRGPHHSQLPHFLTPFRVGCPLRLNFLRRRTMTFAPVTAFIEGTVEARNEPAADFEPYFHRLLCAGEERHSKPCTTTLRVARYIRIDSRYQSPDSGNAAALLRVRIKRPGRIEFGAPIWPILILHRVCNFEGRRIVEASERH